MCAITHAHLYYHIPSCNAEKVETVLCYSHLKQASDFWGKLTVDTRVLCAFSSKDASREENAKTKVITVLQSDPSQHKEKHSAAKRVTLPNDPQRRIMKLSQSHVTLLFLSSCYSHIMLVAVKVNWLYTPQKHIQSSYEESVDR